LVNKSRGLVLSLVISAPFIFERIIRQVSFDAVVAVFNNQLSSSTGGSGGDDNEAEAS